MPPPPNPLSNQPQPQSSNPLPPREGLAPEEELSPATSQQVASGLQALLAHLQTNPEVAYVLGSIKKGLAGVDVAGLSEEDKLELLAKVKEVLQRSPSVLKALRTYRG